MTSERDDRRLVQRRDESPEVRGLLEAGITGDVADYDFDGGLQAHLAAVGTLPATPGDGASSPSAAGAPPGAAGVAPAKVALSWLGVPVATLGVAAALWLGAGSTHSPGGSVTKPADVASAAVPEAPPGRGSSADHEPAPRGPAAAESQTIGATPALGAARADGAGSRITPAASTHHHGTAPQHAAAPPEDRPGSLPGSGASTEAPPAASPPAAAVETTSATAEPGTTDALAETSSNAREEEAKRAAECLRHDMDLLADAKRALATDPALALTLARRGEAEMPRSLLAEERRHVLILALIGLGRTSEARRLAGPYLRQYPDSPFARRVQSALDGAR